MADVRPVQISDWARALARKNAADKRGRRKISRKTVARCFSLASVIFDAAVEREIRPDNPCRGIKIRGAGVNGKNSNPEEVDEVWDWLRVEEQRAAGHVRGDPGVGPVLDALRVGDRSPPGGAMGLGAPGSPPGRRAAARVRALRVKRQAAEEREDAQGPPLRGLARGRAPLAGDPGRVAGARAGSRRGKKGERLPCPELVFPTVTGCRRGVGAPDRATWDPVTKKGGKEDLLSRSG